MLPGPSEPPPLLGAHATITAPVDEATVNQEAADKATAEAARAEADKATADKEVAEADKATADKEAAEAAKAEADKATADTATAEAGKATAEANAATEYQRRQSRRLDTVPFDEVGSSPLPGAAHTYPSGAPQE